MVEIVVVIALAGVAVPMLLGSLATAVQDVVDPPHQRRFRARS